MQGSVWLKYLEEFVTFAQLNRLFPAVISFEQVGSNATKLGKFVVFQLLSQGNLVEVVIGINAKVGGLSTPPQRSPGA